MKLKDIERMVRSLISERVEAGLTLERSKIVPEIIASQGEINGPGSEFFYCLAHEGVYRITKSVIDKLNNDLSDGQMMLDGFSLRKAYSFPTGDGDCVIIPIQLCTKEQLLERADDHDKQAAGHLKHAEELRRYVADKFR